MRITYDLKVKAMYIYISEGEVARTQMVNETTILDYDKDGQVRGVELLNVEEPQQVVYELLSKRIVESK